MPKKTRPKESEAKVSDTERVKLREIVAEYRRSEGCSCCRRELEHVAAENELARILKPLRYSDDSGWDWTKGQSE